MTPAIMAEEKPKRRNPEVFAGPCPHCGSRSTFVGRTYALIRRCYCRKCQGPGWKQLPKRD
jgi:hypothetical protein